MKRAIFSIAALAFVSLAGYAQVKVEAGTKQTIIGGGSIPTNLPSLWIKGGYGYNSPYSSLPTSPAKIEMGTSTGMIRLSENDPFYPQLDIYSNLGTTFSGIQGIYMKYMPNSTDPSSSMLDILCGKTTAKQLNVNSLYVSGYSEADYIWGTWVSGETIYGNSIYYYHTCSQASDSRFKRNIVPLKGSSLSQLSKLNGVTYNLDFSEHPTLRKDPLNENTEADKVTIPKDTTTQIGFIAQELRGVFPQLVKEDKDGYLSVNYIGLIPVIVEALKEQQTINQAQLQKITELQTELNALRSGITTPPSKSLAVQNAFLYQNTPNPFSHSTTIRYFMGEETANASIYIFDMQGKLIESYPVSGAGEGAIEISASGLQPGMYLYSLLVNNQEVDTKRMVITE